ncbi:uncharacterized protein LOC107876168 isoform X1 [Capsicum annuum]|uniref:uncharacterized protein LOC107876168 isoform X1 n=1 Tax=Capsicum annuum TaxID=4072 RepID=UPI001FB1367F|nr:uncharacterized protein LOC107876168 isoform X1 [Capsicum annuum]XP_047269647.1 uncharacterized protein LOC107876168 isoform X1 [Capsicum annuum]
MKHACVVVIYVSAVSTSKKPFLFTIWDDLADNEGAALLHHLHEYPVILAKRISVTEFRCALRLATRYQTTILTNPQVKHNEQMLLSYTLRGSSSSPSLLNLEHVEDQVVSISAITELLSTVQTFPVEGRISLPNHPKSFYLLACSTCNHYVHPKTIKTVQCFNCNLHRVLVTSFHMMPSRFRTQQQLAQLRQPSLKRWEKDYCP